MRTVIRATLMTSGAVSLTVFAVVFGAAFARDRKRQRQEQDRIWLTAGGRHA